MEKPNRILHLGGSQRYSTNVEEPRTSSLPGEQVICGRSDDMGLLVQFLLEGAMEESWNVVPIVAAAVVGKTTLLQKIYHYPAVSEHFGDLRVWVSACGGLQMVELMKKIGESLPGKPGSYNDLGAVQDHLKEAVNGRRILLVLDDIWYETVDGDHWEELRATVHGCADGSVIVLTTPDKRVADRTGTVPNYFLDSLSDEACRSVLQKYAFGSPTSDPRLEEIVTNVAMECEGSPLFAKELGLRLRDERDPGKWEEFFQRGIWDVDLAELELRCRHLPGHLKRCFVYCSMFPEGYLFNREELVWLWVAQGFIAEAKKEGSLEDEEEKKEESLEDKGLKYFGELSIMSLLQRSDVDTGAFVMPNLVRGVAQSISGRECDSMCKLSRGDVQKLHHLSLIPSNGEYSTQFLSLATQLQSLILVAPTWDLKKIAHINLSDETFCHLNCLRVLDVRQTDIEDLPDTIGNLKHLRYLNLSGTKVKSIHASVFRLYNLQILDVSRTAIEELPVEIGNLSNLRHLRLNVTKLREIPASIGKLSELQSLHLGDTKIEKLPDKIGSLKCLKFLYLDVSKIQRLPASIRGLSELQSLELQGVGEGDSEVQLNEHSDQSVVYQDVSDIPDSNIKYLTCKRVGHNECEGSSSDAVKGENVEFLAWMGDPSFSKLTYVVLKNCMMCKTLPQLGQLPLLKELVIDGMLVEDVGRGFCGQGESFKSLEKLSFQNMYKWQKWDGVENGDFDRLQELILFNCPTLEGIPCFHSCGTLTKLKMERCAVSTIPSIGSIQELELCACDKLVTLPELSSLSDLRCLTLMYCQNLKCPPSVPSLEELWVEECEQLIL